MGRDLTLWLSPWSDKVRGASDMADYVQSIIDINREYTLFGAIAGFQREGFGPVIVTPLSADAPVVPYELEGLETKETEDAYGKPLTFIRPKDCRALVKRSQDKRTRHALRYLGAFPACARIYVYWH